MTTTVKVNVSVIYIGTCYPPLSTKTTMYSWMNIHASIGKITFIVEIDNRRYNKKQTKNSSEKIAAFKLRKNFSTFFGLLENVTICFYVSKKNKVVVLLSTINPKLLKFVTESNLIST